jgi:hypothetical protein
VPHYYAQFALRHLSKRFKTIKTEGNLEMSVDNQSRRQFVKVATVGAAAAAVIALPAGTAGAYQGNMENALGALNHALALLRRATPDKGGHKATAVRLIEQAIGEVQAGIAFAAEKFGD